MKLVEVKLEELQPYWRNPRSNEAAVESVKKSIESYDYQAPMVVDQDYTLIVGHTRYLALKELGYEKVDVVVSDMDKEKAQQYRIADNKTGELATWRKDSLMAELRAAEGALEYFTEGEKLQLLDTEIGQSRRHGVTQASIEAAEEKLTNKFTAANKKAMSGMIEVACKECGEEFAIQREQALKTAKLDAKDKKIKDQRERKARSEREGGAS